MTAEDRQRAIHNHLERLCMERERDKTEARKDARVGIALLIVLGLTNAFILAMATWSIIDNRAGSYLWIILLMDAALLALNSRNFMKIRSSRESMQRSHASFQSTLEISIEQTEDLLSVYDPGGTEQ